MAAGLLLVSRALSHRALQGLAIGGLGMFGVDLDPKAPLKALQRQTHMALALTG